MSSIDFNEISHLKIWDGIHGALFHSDQITCGHITLEQGAALPEHQHHNEQWTHVLEGRLRFTMGGESKTLEPGMTAHIPCNIPHSAMALTKCRVIDVFMPVREDFKTLDPWIG